jgi:hypothetical protein
MSQASEVMRGKHYGLNDLPWEQKQYREVAVVELKKGESAVNPTCLTCKLWGPCKVTFTRWQDGGIEAIVN